jgi:hypothetical protein
LVVEAERGLEVVVEAERGLEVVVVEGERVDIGGGLVSFVVERDLRVNTEEMRDLSVGFGVGDSILKTMR